MQQMPRNYSPFDPRFRGQPSQPPRKRYRWCFRWGIVWVVLTILICVWFLNGVGEVNFDWEDVMEALHVPRGSYDSYRRLTVLAILGVALTLIVKVSRTK